MKPKDRILASLAKLVDEGIAAEKAFRTKAATDLFATICYRAEDTAASIHAAAGAQDMLEYLNSTPDDFEGYVASMTHSMLTHLTLRVPNTFAQRAEWEAHRLLHRALTHLHA